MSTGALEKGASQGIPVKLVMLGGAVLILLAGVFAFDRSRAAQRTADSRVAEAEVSLAQAKDRQQLAQRNRALIEGAQKLQKLADETAYLPGGWGERQINMRQTNLLRSQVNPLLMSSARNKDQLLKLEEFDLAVTHSQEGLFEVLPDSRQPLMLTFRGSLYFRLSERSL
ncbi:hypothetical protein [Undibacterium fentianense]|uniref:Uncharacterized protein n=1 Tax=Undibacterium fentianense TaxID=2828728 RepID=A0A941E579_9BURK|nr:hypothetical protein [Undibacterium fentianense]MBR7800849.1 hypothetical protein [Undibacterium fentianense]